jgi:hypothetical protein
MERVNSILQFVAVCLAIFIGEERHERLLSASPDPCWRLGERETITLVTKELAITGRARSGSGGREKDGRDQREIGLQQSKAPIYLTRLSERLVKHAPHSLSLGRQYKTLSHFLCSEPYHCRTDSLRSFSDPKTPMSVTDSSILHLAMRLFVDDPIFVGLDSISLLPISFLNKPILMGALALLLPRDIPAVSARLSSLGEVATDRIRAPGASARALSASRICRTGTAVWYGSPGTRWALVGPRRRPWRSGSGFRNLRR